MKRMVQSRLRNPKGKELRLREFHTGRANKVAFCLYHALLNEGRKDGEEESGVSISEDNENEGGLRSENVREKKEDGLCPIIV